MRGLLAVFVRRVAVVTGIGVATVVIGLVLLRLGVL